MRVALVDYGTGNLHSLASALRAGGATVRVERDLAAAASSSAMVLPGAGAFPAVAPRLAPGADDLRRAIAAGIPCLAIGVGMELLFEGLEGGAVAGLSIFPGQVRRLSARRVPHIGWNDVEAAASDPILPESEFTAWFAHTAIVDPLDPRAVIAWTSCDGATFPAAIRLARVWGLQFHPEKSGAAGAALLRRFLALAGQH